MTIKDTPVDRAKNASLGGLARRESLSPEKRSTIARDAALSRWDENLPRAECDGDLEIAGRLIACAVLNTTKRVLTQGSFMTAVGRASKPKGGHGSARLGSVDGLPPFLAAENLQNFITDELRESATPIVFRTTRGNKAYGYDAKLLPMVCDVYLKARDAHLEELEAAQKEKRAPRPVLLPTQEHIVKACDLLMRGLAHVGIIALVDQATGYEDRRAREEVYKILERYIAPHLLPWTKRFPDEFFRQVYRLYGWKYVPGSVKRPQCVGNFINKYIYGQMPAVVVEKLRELNPVTETGHRKWKLFQNLTVNTGDEHLDKQITSSTALMLAADDHKDFDRLYKKAYPKPQIGAAKQGPMIVRVEEKSSAQISLFPPSMFGDVSEQTTE